MTNESGKSEREGACVQEENRLAGREMSSERVCVRVRARVAKRERERDGPTPTERAPGEF